MNKEEQERLSQQCEDLLGWFQYHYSITPLEAIGELGIWRLAARICDLKKAGHKIESEWYPFMSKNGRIGRVKRYMKVE